MPAIGVNTSAERVTMTETGDVERKTTTHTLPAKVTTPLTAAGTTVKETNLPETEERNTEKEPRMSSAVTSLSLASTSVTSTGYSNSKLSSFISKLHTTFAPDHYPIDTLPTTQGNPHTKIIHSTRTFGYDPDEEKTNLIPNFVTPQGSDHTVKSTQLSTSHSVVREHTSGLPHIAYPIGGVLGIFTFIILLIIVFVCYSKRQSK